MPMVNRKFAAIQRIKDRYYRKVIAGTMVAHHGDCKIHTADYPHCSCGLIHDLLPLHYSSRIFPKFSKDRAISDGVGTIHPKLTPEQIAATEGIMDKWIEEGIFKPATSLPPEAEQAVLDEDEAITKLLGL